MTGETVLIAAYSGRALAQSARRAGYVPLVVDAFGDIDAREAAEYYATLPGAITSGFSSKPLTAALDSLIARASSRPIGIVLGSGFEDRPKLIRHLDERYRLLGTRADVVQETKDPGQLRALLKQLGIRHPEISLEPPAEADGWIAKRTGGAGGAHIRDHQPERGHREGTYYQRRLSGTPMSVLAIASHGGVALELSRQWTSPSERKPYRYGGAVIIDYSDSTAEQHMVSAAATLVELLDPLGLVSFDFLVDGDTAYLLEINPRPGATLDIFDDAKGNLFRAHVEAALGNTLWQRRDLPPEPSRASAVLYADRGGLTMHALDWPDWSADRPAPGTKIPANAPLATVHAAGASAQEAEAQVRERLLELDNLVYTSNTQKT